MAYNLTVDDFDPVVHYSSEAQWTTPNPQDNPDWYNKTEAETGSPWSQATYHHTTVDGASLTYNFTGTHISVQGSAGPNPKWDLVIDGETHAQTNDFSTGHNVNKSVVLAEYDVKDGQHTVTITNRGGGLLIDSITTRLMLGQEGTQLKTTQLDDRAPEIKFSGDWTQQNLAAAHDGTSTYTSGPGNAFEYNFTGSAIWVWGDQVNDHGEYTASINGTTYATLSGHSGCGSDDFAKFCEKIHALKFFAGELPQGTHTLRIENGGPSEGNKTFFDFDYLEVATPEQYATTSVPGPPGSANASGTDSAGGSTSSAPSGGAGSGASVLGASSASLALAFVVGSWFGLF